MSPSEGHAYAVVSANVCADGHERTVDREPE
jgi:hypothetical protein